MSGALGLGLGLVTSLLLAEFLDCAAWAAPRLIRHAASKLSSPAAQERYEEEWLAELATLDGLKLAKLVKAFSIWLGAHRMRVTTAPGRVQTARTYVATLIHHLPLLATVAFQQERPDDGVRADGRMPKQVAVDMLFSMIVLDTAPDLSIGSPRDDDGVIRRTIITTSRPAYVTRWAAAAYGLSKILCYVLIFTGTVWSTRSIRNVRGQVHLTDMRSLYRRV